MTTMSASGSAMSHLSSLWKWLRKGGGGGEERKGRGGEGRGKEKTRLKSGSHQHHSKHVCAVLRELRASECACEPVCMCASVCQCDEGPLATGHLF